MNEKTKLWLKRIAMFVLPITLLTLIFWPFGIPGVGLIIGAILSTLILLFHFFGDSPAFTGWVMTFILVLIGSFLSTILLSGWAGFLESEAQDTSAQLGLSGTFDNTGAALKDAWLNVWTLMTDPQKWYEQQFVKRGDRGEGDTSRAVEFSAAQVIPRQASKGDSIILQTEITNQGNDFATNIVFDATLDPRSASYGAMVVSDPQTIDLLAPSQSQIMFSDLNAPQCPGTFEVFAQAEYDYTVSAIKNLEVIGREKYTELTTQGELQFKNSESISSAGPFLLTLNTDRQFPIPVNHFDTGNRHMRLFIGISNEGDGDANISDTLLELPKGLVIHDPATCEFGLVSQEADFNKYRLIGGSGTRNLNDIEENDLRLFKCDMRYVEPVDDVQTLFVRMELNYSYIVDRSTTFTVVRSGGELTCDELDALAAKQPKTYIKDVALDCGDKNANVPTNGENDGWREATPSGVPLSSGGFADDECQLFVNNVDRKLFVDGTAGVEPINAIGLVCGSGSPSGGDWTKVRAQRKQISEDNSVRDCFLFYKRGRENPIYALHTLGIKDSPGPSYGGFRVLQTKYIMETASWNKDGYFIFKHCLNMK